MVINITPTEPWGMSYDIRAAQLDTTINLAAKKNAIVTSVYCNNAEGHAVFIVNFVGTAQSLAETEAYGASKIFPSAELINKIRIVLL